MFDLLQALWSVASTIKNLVTGEATGISWFGWLIIAWIAYAAIHAAWDTGRKRQRATK